MSELVMTALTPKQEKFAYSVGTAEFDYPWESYAKYYDVKKMSKNAIYVESCRLLQNPKISLRIKEIRELNQKQNEIQLMELLERMSRWVRFNPKLIHKEDGSIKQMNEMTDEEAECIQAFETVNLFDGTGEKRVHIGYTAKVKIIDKRATADMFMKKLGVYVTKLKLDSEDLEHIQDLVNSINK